MTGLSITPDMRDIDSDSPLTTEADEPIVNLEEAQKLLDD